jgi:hypothetical protein
MKSAIGTNHFFFRRNLTKIIPRRRRGHAQAVQAEVVSVDRSEGVLGEGAVEAVDVRQPGFSWARRVLLGLSAAHAVALFYTSVGGPLGLDVGFLLLLNALAIAGLVTRTRAGWVAALLCVLVAGVRWASIGVDETAGLLALLAVTAAVFCVTDPSLRREHGIAS